MKSKETLEGLRPYIPGRPIDDVKKEFAKRCIPIIM